MNVEPLAARPESLLLLVTISLGMEPPQHSFSRQSVMSEASAYSQTPSTRPMLASPNHQQHFHESDRLDPPMIMGSSNNSTSSLNGGGGGSLTAHYVPSKLAGGLLSPNPGGARRRKRKPAFDTGIPKQGGGVEAFKSGEARLPGEVDEDYDGVDDSGWFGGGKQKKKKLRWNKFKWWIFIANICLTLWTIGGLIVCLLTWFKVFHRADIVLVGNTTELILCTLVASLGILNSLVGWAGILLNNRAFLAWWSFLNWIVFALLLAPSYLTFRRRRLNLEGKLNQEWSQFLHPEGRLRIQDQLGCCGFWDPYVGATMSQTCYSRTVLPGCKLMYLQFQRMALSRFYIAGFAVVPLQMAIMLAGLLCSNHVTYRFGKGMMPPAYRLSMNSMAVIMENYANQLAEQYGSDVASDMLAKSRSNLNLNVNDGLQNPRSPMGSPGPIGPMQTTTHNHRKYDSVQQGE